MVFMARKPYSAKQKQRVIELAGKGYSANRIQKTLHREHMGMRRKTLLKLVREHKHVPPEKSRVVHREKYIPKKYRKYRRETVGYPLLGKQIAVYGTVNGQSRRVEMSGNGRQLYNAMFIVAKHPPKKRFLVANASKINNYPNVFLDLRREWDEHPEVKS